MQQRFEWPVIAAALLMIPQIVLSRAESGSGPAVSQRRHLVRVRTGTGRDPGGSAGSLAGDPPARAADHPADAADHACVAPGGALLRLLRPVQVVRRLTPGQALEFAALIAC